MKRKSSGPSPRALLDSFVKTMVDALARAWGGPALAQKVQHAGLPGASGPWLAALTETPVEPRVEGSPARLAALERSLQNWLRNLQVAGTGDFRVAFRLAPPPPPSLNENGAVQAMPAEGWDLHYLLQARDDPSLLLPATAVWQAGGDIIKDLGRRLEQPQEQLLAGLGYAAQLYPPITRSLQRATPDELPLSTEEAFGFLREAAPLLEQSGFGVLVPPWWNRPGSRLGLRLRARPRRGTSDVVAGSGLGQRAADRIPVGCCGGRYDADAGGVRDAGGAQVAPGAGARAVGATGCRAGQRGPAFLAIAAVIRRGLAAGDAADGPCAGDGTAGLLVETVEFEGWLQEWVERLRSHDQVTTLPQPAGLRGQLRPYQVYGYSWLEFLRRYGLGACLADDMGLGKSIETIALLQRDNEQGAAAGPVLLICPTSVVGNWQREVQRFAPDLTVWVHQGNQRLRDVEFAGAAAEHDLVLTSYPLVRRDAGSLAAVSWRGVILDEAQNIKNPETQQTQAIHHLPAGFRIALTGTPVENRLAELWSIMQFLNPGFLGARARFRRNYAVPIERYADEAAGQRLRDLVGPFILRRVKTDPRVIQDLPDKLEMKVYCNLSEEQASLYQAVVEESLAQVEEAEGIDRRGQVLAMLMKLKQVCDHPALFLHQMGPATGAGQTAGSVADLEDRSGKLDRLVEMLEEALAAGDRALIFTQFAEMGRVLHGYLPMALGCPALFLHGGVPAAQRDQIVARFQSAGGPPIFILSLKAGGVGLNLTHANHVFHFDRWWNPAVEDQATDRAFRIGQTRNVQVHKFVSIGTLEEKIDDLIENKRRLAQSIIGAGENWLTEISTDQLRELVALRREQP